MFFLNTQAAGYHHLSPSKLQRRFLSFFFFLFKKLNFFRVGKRSILVQSLGHQSIEYCLFHKVSVGIGVLVQQEAVCGETE